VSQALVFYSIPRSFGVLRRTLEGFVHCAAMKAVATI